MNSYQTYKYYPFSSSAVCTTTYLKIAKKCVTDIEVDFGCLKQLYEVCRCENVASVKLGSDSGSIVLSFFTHNSLFQNLPKGKACFCGGHLKFSQMLTSVAALLCDETESEDQGRQSRLFFPGGLGNLPGGLGNLPGGLGNLPGELGNLPGGLGNLPNALKTLSLTLFQPTVAPTTTGSSAAPTTTATSAAPTTTANNAQIAALDEKAELLENNINSLKEARAAVEKAVAAARRRKRAAATTCSGFISLVQKRKTFPI